MRLYVESLLVGCYSLFMSFLMLNNFRYNYQILNAFIIGFTKHFLAGVSGIHKCYCSNKLRRKCTHNFDIIKLIIESVFEGILFSLPFTLLLLTTYAIVDKNSLYIVFFLIGSLLHISFESLGFHQKFCVNYCN